jgi:hypothetical protein
MRLFEVEKDGDVTRKWYGDEDGNAHLQTIQDVNPTLKEVHDINTSGAWQGKDMWLGAIIPNGVILEWLKLGIDINKKEDMPKIKKLLNGEYSYLKTTPKKL